MGQFNSAPEVCRDPPADGTGGQNVAIKGAVYVVKGWNPYDLKAVEVTRKTPIAAAKVAALWRSAGYKHVVAMRERDE
jgi:hypothetical protein